MVWTCLTKGLDFELHPLGVGEMGEGSPLLALNPTGQIPTVDDDGFALYEMSAILIYLCEKHGWDDLLPKELAARARVHQALHFHHNWTRRVTMELMAPHVIIAFLDRISGEGVAGLKEKAAAPNKLEVGQAAATHVCGLIEVGYLRGGDRFLCAAHPTIADIACYEELSQLRWAKLFDFDPFPKVSRWLEAMAELPFHEPVHRYNATLGDIQTDPNTLERFLGATVAGIEALEEVGVRVVEQVEG